MPSIIVLLRDSHRYYRWLMYNNPHQFEQLIQMGAYSTAAAAALLFILLICFFAAFAKMNDILAELKKLNSKS